MRIRIESRNLPGHHSGKHRDVHVGVQRRVAATISSIRFQRKS
jgi:hypothetical protein